MGGDVSLGAGTLPDTGLHARQNGGQVVGEVACPIGGLLSDRPAEEVAAAVRHMHEAVRGLGATLPSPFMAMSFLALSVVPELKITDRGLVDTVKFELVPLEV